MGIVNVNYIETIQSNGVKTQRTKKVTQKSVKFALAKFSDTIYFVFVILTEIKQQRFSHI